MDLLPTFAEIAGAALPERVIDGRSLWPLLSGKTRQGPREVFYYFVGNGPGQARFQAVRDRRWKLVVKQSEDEDKLFEPAALYDLHRDVGERDDRREDHPEEAARLEAMARAEYVTFRDQIRPLGRLTAGDTDASR